ncbi:hypothetical protein Lepto7376_2263 [[Leptolyngbya] sp. PCC 7376]|uniref:hypothetical protein n=1 Tax=[Leptolyngbya] sp. PCC 7376 TaxID=111781 RepID=UPI00029F3C8D|nr:hypothetical protein [[Leptolyngbya] sp. PCC 7376]AFY38553.1 hypothetical protein Lepto7376_2263 [[Leptolyngbya] sp. PCC 7376]
MSRTYSYQYAGVVGFGFGSGFVALFTFFILQWLHIPVGNLVDWLIGIASFWWLLAVVTIPWNIYFEAMATLDEAKISEKKEIPVDKQQLMYVAKVARWALIGAITLHILSAIALYALAAWGISAVGYVSAFAVLLLTILRPAVRGYQFLAFKLSNIRQQIQYPREDIVELRARVQTLESISESLQKTLDKTSEEQTEEYSEIRQSMAKLRSKLEELAAVNQTEHQRLAREATGAIAQLSEDSQVLNHVREIIRFWKDA